MTIKEGARLMAALAEVKPDAQLVYNKHIPVAKIEYDDSNEIVNLGTYDRTE